jgi:biopolymer transport protein ExbB/TolQ
MSQLWQLVDRGGPVMYFIIGLSLLLYTQCVKLLISVYRAQRSVAGGEALGPEQVARLEVRQKELADEFRNRRLLIASMIAAAPLLGLLGTVSGMAHTFEGLSSQSGQRSMGALARGISEVLVATESGLSVAIPALILVYVAHREIDKHELTLNLLKERAAWKGPR